MSNNFEFNLKETAFNTLDRDLSIRVNHPDNEFNKLLKETDSINHLELYNLVTKEGASPFCFLLYHLYGENENQFCYNH